MSVEICDQLNMCIIQKDPETKLIKINFMEYPRGIIINNHMWAVFDDNTVEGENWDIDNIKADLSNHENLTDVAILKEIKDKIIVKVYDDEFINLLLLFRHYSF